MLTGGVMMNAGEGDKNVVDVGWTPHAIERRLNVDDVDDESRA